MDPKASSDIERLQTDAEYMHFLIEAGELLSSSLDYRNTLRNVCVAAVETVADICVLDVGSVRDVETVGAAERGESAFRFSGEHIAHEAGRPLPPVLRVLDSGQALLIPNIDDAWIAAHASSARQEAFLREHDVRSMIVAPVRSQIWGVAGALTLIRCGDNSKAYDEAALRFATDLGRRCGIAIGKARLHSQTVDIAERLQRAALPHSIPHVPNLRFDVLYEPADAALLVGGDWYDVFHLKNGLIGVSIGDVSGHGIDSAAQMSSIRNAIRMGMVMESDLQKVLIDADFLFRNEVEDGTFCTALVAVIDPHSGVMTCASAGHPGPMMWSRGRITEVLTQSSPPLAFGNLAHEKPTVDTVQLEPACTVVFYTDGLVEAGKLPKNGLTALAAALSDASVRNAAEPARAIRKACIPGAHADDIAVLVVKYEPGA